MKYRKVVIVAAVITALMLFFSIASNIRYASRHAYAKTVVFSQIYTKVQNTINSLDFIIDNQEYGSDPFDRYSLEKAAINLANIDSLVRQNSYYFREALYHPGILSFDYIAETLIGGVFVTNGITIHGILKDDIITEDEIQYMSLLRDDLQSIVNEMVGEDRLNVNEDLTIAQVNSILKIFYARWSSFQHEDCPYLLLRQV